MAFLLSKEGLVFMKRLEIQEKDRVVLENSNIPFCIYRYDTGRIFAILASKGFCNYFNLSHKDTLYFLNNDRYKYYDPKYKKNGAEAFYRFSFDGDIYNHDFRFRRGLDKEYENIFSRGFHIYTNDGTRLLLVYYYTDQKEIEIMKNEDLNKVYLEKLIAEISCKYLSFAKIRDEKTGLLSMSYFYELGKRFIDNKIDSGKNPVFLAFDFINMRLFNSTYGFEEGNHIIEKFGNILRSEFGDYECTHISADHFCAYADEEDVEKRLIRVFENLKKENDGKTISVRTGIYINRSGKKIESTTAYERAKIACDSIRNSIESSYIFFDDAMLESLENEAYVINNLDRAMEERWIKVYYQPIVRGIINKISDAEALARWIDPIKGMLVPSEFIPVLENARLLYKLDLYILDCILEEFKIREENDIPLVPVSINLSRYDFEACDMVYEIAKRIKDSGYSTNLITVEITESVVGSDPEYLKEQIERFHQAGIKVWMDDFGSGYSTLNILSDFDFDLIKLDMKFIRSYKKNPKVAITIANLIYMAEDLGVDVLCEGVETKDEAEFLIKTGCDKLQGYYYSKPSPMDVILKRELNYQFELMGEASYYENISMRSLYNVEANTDDIYVSNQLGHNVGILEYKEGRYYFLRGTDSYIKFLNNFKGLMNNHDNKLNMESNIELHSIFNHGSVCAIQSGNWEHINYESDDGFVIDFSIKCIGHNEVTNCYALMIIALPSHTRNKKIKEKYDPEFNVPYAVFKVILNEDENEVIDTEFVYANDVYCKSINKKLTDIVGKSFLKNTPGASNIWFPYCYKAAVLGETVRSTLYSTETKQWLGFVVSPTNEPLCCSFVFMNFDKENEKQQFLRIKSDTEEAIINITNTLTFEKNNNKAFTNVVKDIKKLCMSEFVFLIQDNSKNKDIIIETTGIDSVENLELVRNEFLSLIKSVSNLKDNDGLISVSDDLGQQFFYGTSKINAYNLLAVSIYDIDKSVIGYVGLLNYKDDIAINMAVVLKHISLYLASRIVQGLMVERLQYQSYYDALTDVLNRKGFNKCADEYFTNNYDKPAVYMIVDIDDFKFINDLHGHYVGDKTLKHFAQFIKSYFTENAIIGRSGGDEFQILLTNTTLEQAIPLIDKFSYLEKKVIADGKEIVYEVSIGYAEYPNQADDAVKLLTMADAALYYSKTNQGTCANCYRNEMNMTSRSQLGFGLKDIARNMPAAMLIYEATGAENILYVNDELVRMFDCEDTEDFLEYVHGSFFGMVHPDDLDSVKESIWRQINDVSNVQNNDFVEYRIITKKGVTKRIIDNGRLVDSKFYGKVFYVILIEEEPHTSSNKK